MSVLNFMGVMPSFLREPENFSREYFHHSKYFLMGISWVQNILTWVFRVSQIFSRRYFVGPNFFLVGVSRVQDFFSLYFVGPRFYDFHVTLIKNKTEHMIEEF